MLKIKQTIQLDDLRKYGFKQGTEYPDNERCICNDYEREDFWLISMESDNPDEVEYAEEDLPLWSIHINTERRLWIECVPFGDFCINSFDIENMLHTLYQMISDGVIEDSYDGRVNTCC